MAKRSLNTSYNREGKKRVIIRKEHTATRKSSGAVMDLYYNQELRAIAAFSQRTQELKRKQG
ncbi:MAG: hypothetical protein U0T73_02955 [Chitinophagales bacterium]